jgi:EpsI family protein
MAPNTSAPWRPAPDRTAAWRPSIPGVDAEVLRSYATEAAEVTVYIGYFAEERQGAEAVNELNDWAGPSGWRIRDTTRAVLPVDGAPLDIPCLSLSRGAERRLVCHWYWVDGEMTGSPYIAKLLRARAQIFGGKASAAVLAVGVSNAEQPEAALEVLRNFLAVSEPLGSLLDAVARQP